MQKNHYGDEGITKNFLGHPQPKSNQFIEAIGTIDELNAFLGLIRFICPESEKNYLNRIQLQLMSFMSIISGYKDNKSFITTDELDILIDKYEKNKPSSPSHFIIPGNQEIPTFINIARTICRRAERRTVAMNTSKNIIQFLNRLSTYLFALQIYCS